ncbi:hypothetical protein ACH4ND_01400 [Streptomyces sp. NPDC017179]|uniref:hypothetical protein n=1 Tax=Streptomyces sp. NPDC017179 TaxID=3364979 RepID=UPI00379DACA8
MTSLLLVAVLAAAAGWCCGHRTARIRHVPVGATEAQDRATLTGQAADEDEQRTARRRTTAVLLARMQHGVLTPDEATLLRQHVDTEAREADTARAVARGNLRHVQLIVPDLERAEDAIDRVRALLPDHPVDDFLAAGLRPARLRAALDGTEQPKETGTP